MQKQYEAPELTLIGQADDVVLGGTSGLNDMVGLGAPDFEFEGLGRCVISRTAGRALSPRADLISAGTRRTRCRRRRPANCIGTR
jgi:hypothetical protein